MSLQQRYMAQALTDVRGVLSQSEEVQTAYGALCHQIPILVLTNGLALTAAWVDAKSEGDSDRAAAFGHMRRHLKGALDARAAETRLSAVVARLDRNGEYMLATFTILDAWAFHKRFAVSLLGVDPGAGNDALGGA